MRARWRRLAPTVDGRSRRRAYGSFHHALTTAPRHEVSDVMSATTDLPTTDLLKARLSIVAALVLAVDQWSKWLIETRFSPTTVIEVVPGLINLIWVENTGVAFGLFPANGDLRTTAILTVLGVTALTLVAVYFFRTPSSELFLLVALALILGGAVGNLVDRIMRGSVTDFIDVHVGAHHWPTFNVADSAISIGLAFMALEILRPIRRASVEQESV